MSIRRASGCRIEMRLIRGKGKALVLSHSESEFCCLSSAKLVYESDKARCDRGQVCPLCVPVGSIPGFGQKTPMQVAVAGEYLFFHQAIAVLRKDILQLGNRGLAHQSELRL